MKHFKYLPLCALVLFLMPEGLLAQDLFDRNHSARYADFLFASGNYREAIEEYERLVFSFGATEEKKLRLLQSYRLSGHPEVAIRRMNSLWEEPDRVSGAVAKELFTLRIINRDFNNLEPSIGGNPYLSQEEKDFFTASSFLFQEQFRETRDLLENRHVARSERLSDFLEISQEALSMKMKSPWLGGALSAVVPGAGKFYTGNWEDGLIAMSIVGASAWQAYRGFDRKGSGSVYAWAYSLIGTAFYIGNIYGSVKEVNRYNFRKREGIRIRVEAVFFHGL